MCAILIARILKPELLGVYAVTLTVASLVALPVIHGLPTLVMRELAGAGKNARPHLLRQAFLFASRIQVVVGLSMLLVTAIVVWGVYDPARTLITTAMVILAVSVQLVMSKINVAAAALRAHGFAVKGQLPELIVRPGLFAICLMLLLYLGVSSVEYALTVGLISAILAWVVAAQLCRHNLILHSKTDREIDWKSWSRALFPLSSAFGVQFLNGQLGVLLLGALATEAEVGLYRVSHTFALQVSFGLTIANMVLAPQFASQFGAGELSSLRETHLQSARIATGFGLAVVLAYLFLGEQMIDVLLGAEYAESFVPMMILALGHVVTLWAGTTNVLLNMVGKESRVMRAGILSAVVNFIFGLVLVSEFGLLGAALSSVIGLACWRILLATELRRFFRGMASG